MGEIGGDGVFGQSGSPGRGNGNLRAVSVLLHDEPVRDLVWREILTTAFSIMFRTVG